MAVFAEDIIPRTTNDEPIRTTANSFATYDELDAAVQFRMDIALWEKADEDLRVRAMVQAYKDLMGLTFSTFRYAPSQTRERNWPFDDTDVNDPPIDDVDFVKAVKEAQLVQVLYLLGGTQVRDMARQGIKMTRALSGSEMEIVGYQGAVCAEARELLSRWIEIFPRLRRF